MITRFSHPLRVHASQRRDPCAGYSLPEVLVGSIILTSAITMAVQLSNSSLDGMQRMNQRSKIDSAIAARMEEIRDVGFRHLCTQGCADAELTLQLKYDLDILRPLCINASLGQSLLTDLQTKELDKNFDLVDYDDTATTKPITTDLQASGNTVLVTLSETTTPVSVTTTIVPHAQGWCR